MSYTPPPSSAADASWLGAAPYTPPAGDSANVSWQPPAPNTLVPSGVPPQGVGTPTVYNLLQRVQVAGIAPPFLGAADVQLSRRYLAPVGEPQGLYGAAFVQGGVRTLYPQLWASSSFGQSVLGFSPRYVLPVGVARPVFALPMVGGSRTLYPQGFVATLFGARITPPERVVAPSGVAGGVGIPSTANLRRYVRPSGFTAASSPDGRFGSAVAYNLRQYLAPLHTTDSLNVGEVWGMWTSIANRNRVIQIHSAAPAAPPRPAVDNAARPLLATGIPAPSTPSYYRAGQVTYRHRSVLPPGLTPPPLSTWARVVNDARVVRQTGARGDTWGLPAVANTRRFLSGVGGIATVTPPVPMIAPRVRALVLDGRYAITPPRVPLPGVQLRTRYIEPRSWGSSGIGGLIAYTHVNRLTTRWTHRDLVGEPALRNLTPEVRTDGRCSEEFGDAAVRTQWRALAHRDPSTTLFGTATVADRTQRVVVGGTDALRMGEIQVIRIDPESFPQTIQVPSLPGFIQVGEPLVGSNVIFVTDPPQGRVGTPTVTANSIRVEPGYWELSIGEPRVELRRRTVGHVAPRDVDSLFGTPDLSPRTIWATPDTPLQAVENHPGLTFTPINPLPGGEAGAAFGVPEATLRHRALGAQGLYAHGSGTPDVFLRRRYVYPEGLASFRRGFHEIWGVPQSIEVDVYEPTTVVGAPVVAFPAGGTQRVYATGFQASAVGPADVSLHRRALYPAGADCALFGASDTTDTPYTWQRLRVGELCPTIPEGTDTSLFGDTWVSNKIREVVTVGSDMFTSTYDPTSFALRMVVRRIAPAPAAQVVRPVGVNTFGSAASNLRPRTQFIRPDGNAEAFRKGIPHE